MFQIEVQRDKLLATLKRNLEQHRKIYREAKDGYRSAVVMAFRDRANKVEAGEKINTYFDLPEPRSYAKHYEDAISLIEWHVGETIQLEQKEFQNFVQDNWDWKDQFIGTTSNYR